MRVRPGLLSSLILVAAASCGSSDGPTPTQVDCSPIQACGGDLDGVWKVRGVCAVNYACAGTNYDFSGVTTTLTFAAGKMTVSGGGMAKDTLPNACFTQSDMGSSATCAGLNSMAGYTCQSGSQSCSCSVDYTRVNQGFTTMGYLISGPQLLVGGITYTYCVFNNVLRLSADLPNGVVGPISEYVKQ